ncbi:DUF2087 domain-containing protein [Microbacterium testaceum]
MRESTATRSSWGGTAPRRTAIVDDVAAMRRYLIDAGLLTRTADGRTYARAGDGAPPCAP